MNLPIVELRQSGQRGSRNPRTRSTSVYWLRLTCLALIVLGLNRAGNSKQVSGEKSSISLEQARDLFGGASSLRMVDPYVEILGTGPDGSQQSIALITTTSPAANHITGYSGPNHVWLELDDSQTVLAAGLIQSFDTQDHAAMVEADQDFWDQFVGLKWGEMDARRFDGVSGATLTSLAIAEAVRFRLSGTRRSLKFPDAPTLAEARDLDQGCEQLEESEGELPTWLALDAAGNQLGWIVRTGNLIDSIEGYQGPSELLLLIQPADPEVESGKGQTETLTGDSVVRQLRLRASYDNEPYVGYVRKEYSFWPMFKNRSLAELAELDLEAEGIEGVSGATMTSIAVAETVRDSAATLLAASRAEHSGPELASTWDQIQNWNWSWTELGTGLIACVAIVFGQSHWRSHRRLRRVWQALCIGFLGLYTGNLLSLALLSGWTSTGIPMGLAPGLSILLVVSLSHPILLRGNVYCDHICPHGAIQQLATPLALRASRANRALAAGKWILKNGLLISCIMFIGMAILWILSGIPVQLAWLEPFDAYATWKIGVSTSLIIWLVSLLVALWRPMAYCRLGCPTGKLLDLLRRAPSKVGWTDIVLVVLCGSIWSLHWLVPA